MLTNIKADIKILNLMGILNGNYNELTPDWFRNVGGALVYAVFLEILLSPQAHLVGYLKAKIKRWFDRGWYCDIQDTSHPSGEKVRTRKSMMLDVKNVYTGP